MPNITSMIILRPQESVIRQSWRASRSRLTNQVHGIQKVLNSLLGTEENSSSSALLMKPASIRWSLVGNLRLTAILIDLRRSQIVLVVGGCLQMSANGKVTLKQVLTRDSHIASGFVAAFDLFRRCTVCTWPHCSSACVEAKVCRWVAAGSPIRWLCKVSNRTYVLIRPRNRLVLIPPSGRDEGYVEAENER